MKQNRRPFFGQQLCVRYAPEMESLRDTRAKLDDRRTTLVRRWQWRRACVGGGWRKDSLPSLPQTLARRGPPTPARDLAGRTALFPHNAQNRGMCLVLRLQRSSVGSLEEPRAPPQARVTRSGSWPRASKPPCFEHEQRWASMSRSVEGYAARDRAQLPPRPPLRPLLLLLRRGAAQSPESKARLRPLAPRRPPPSRREPSAGGESSAHHVAAATGSSPSRDFAVVR